MSKRTVEEMIDDVREMLQPIIEVMDEAMKQGVTINFGIGYKVDDPEKRHAINNLSATKNYPLVPPGSL